MLLSRFTIPRKDVALPWTDSLLLGRDSELGVDLDRSPRSSILGVNAEKSGVPRSDTGEIGGAGGIYGDDDGPGSPGLKIH